MPSAPGSSPERHCLLSCKAPGPLQGPMCQPSAFPVPRQGTSVHTPDRFIPRGRVLPPGAHTRVGGWAEKRQRDKMGRLQALQREAEGC